MYGLEQFEFKNFGLDPTSKAEVSEAISSRSANCFCIECRRDARRGEGVIAFVEVHFKISEGRDVGQADSVILGTSANNHVETRLKARNGDSIGSFVGKDSGRDARQNVRDIDDVVSFVCIEAEASTDCAGADVEVVVQFSTKCFEVEPGGKSLSVDDVCANPEVKNDITSGT